MVYGTLFVFFLSLFHTDIHFIPPAAMIFPFLDISVSLLSSPRPPERTSDSGDSTISVSLLSSPRPPRLHGRQRRQHHLSVPALIPSSPFWPMKPVLSKSVTLRFRTAFQATAASSIATSATPGLSIVTHPKGLPDSNNSRTRIQNLLDEYKSTNAPDSFIWLSIMRYP